eukprot:365466-Chlamydomonas_euryale.AAC.15
MSLGAGAAAAAAAAARSMLLASIPSALAHGLRQGHANAVHDPFRVDGKESHHEMKLRALRKLTQITTTSKA